MDARDIYTFPAPTSALALKAVLFFVAVFDISSRKDLSYCFN
jgi:hypothetical protein